MAVKIMELTFRSAASFVVLLFLGRLVGRKLISRITFFDFIIGVTLGSLGVRLALGMDNTFLDNSISGVTIILMVILTDVLNLKSSLFRKLEEGEPILLIDKGRILDRNLSKARISMSKFLMLLREKSIFNIDEVDFAVLENDGHLSVLLRPDRQPPKAGELNIPKNANRFPVDLIVDGKIIGKSLEKIGQDRDWLCVQLENSNVRSEKDVFYACLNSSGNVFVSLKTQKKSISS